MKEFQMDIRSSEKMAPTMEHQGTTPVWWLVSPREFRAQTLGGHLELISEFEVRAGGEVHPHSHPTYEFYYMISGRAVMTVDGESAEVGAGRFDQHSAARRAQHPAQSARIPAFVRWPSALRSRGAPEIDYTGDTATA